MRQTTPLFSRVTAIIQLIFVDFCANCFVCLDKYLIKVNKRFSGFASKNMCKTDLDHSSLRRCVFAGIFLHLRLMADKSVRGPSGKGNAFSGARKYQLESFERYRSYLRKTQN